MKLVYENNLVTLITEAGDKRLRIVDTKPEEAEKWARLQAEKEGIDFDNEYPDFISNYKKLQSQLKKGWTKRKDMPVINDEDVKLFKERLEKGMLDVVKPFTNKDKPFPEFLTGKNAKEFFGYGLKDGLVDDDKIKVKKEMVAAKDLKPIQQEVYMDKSFINLVKFGKGASKKFLGTTSMIISKDNYIIDGHHRLSQSIFIDPGMKLSCVRVDLPIDTLLKISLAYGDAIGNERNESLGYHA